MKKYIGVALLATIPTIASAGTQTQTVEFNNTDFAGEFINFARFDTMGGTRELTGLRLSYDQSFAMEILVESNGPTGVSAGDWDLEAGFYGLHQFGITSSGDENFPLVGTGGIFDVFTADLGASDGFNGTGPDTYLASLSASNIFVGEYDRTTIHGGRMLDVFTGGGVLETYLNGISEFLGQWHTDPGWKIDPDNLPDGPWGDGPLGDPYYGFFASFVSMSHIGSIEVTFEYATVPAPGGAALVLGAGFVGLRRRR